jgi:hypothetical protein
VSIAQPRRISDIKPLFTNLAQTSHYQVIFGGLSPDLQFYLSSKGVDPFFVAESVGLLCSSASLPGSTHDTAQINGNYTGVIEKFAHTRIFTEIQLEFLIDKEYKALKFLEHWIEYISSGSKVSQSAPGYYYRMKYPYPDKNGKGGGYKCDQTKILKFDRDYQNEVQYNFYGMFPLSLSSLSVSYEESQILKATASFNYERYVVGNLFSLNTGGSNTSSNQTTTNDAFGLNPDTIAQVQNNNIQQSLGNLTSQQTNADVALAYAPGTNLVPQSNSQTSGSGETLEYLT